MIETVLTEDALIEKYIEDFHQMFDKDLVDIMNGKFINREEMKKKGFLVSLPKILAIVNESIPDDVTYTNTIIGKWKTHKIVILRNIFAFISTQNGHSRRSVQDMMGIHHSTIITQLKMMKRALSTVYTYEDILASYEIILDKIQQENARLIQCNLDQSPDPKPDVFTVLNP